MSGRVEGKVAFITGAGRGQGRSHAIRLAEEGCDIIAVDVLEDYPTVRYAMSSRAELDETVRAVEAFGRSIVAIKADVRDAVTLRAALDAGVAELGGLNIVCANGGIYTVQPWDQVTAQVWQDTIDTNLTGVSRSPDLGAIFTNGLPVEASTRATSATRCCGSPLTRHATSPALP